MAKRKRDHTPTHTPTFITSKKPKLEIQGSLKPSKEHSDILIQELFYKAKQGSFEHVQTLVEFNPYLINSKNTEGTPLLHFVFKNNHKFTTKTDVNNFTHFSAFEYLLYYSPIVNPNIQDSDGYSILHLSVIRNDKKYVKLLSNDKRIDCNLEDYSGQTPLVRAVKEKNIEITKILLNSKYVNCNYADDECGYTALHTAVIENNLEIVKVLIASERVDCNLEDEDGYTPIHLAVIENNLEIVEALINSDRVNVDAKDSYGSTALDIAISDDKDTDIIRILTSKSKLDHKVEDTKSYSAGFDTPDVADENDCNLNNYETETLGNDGSSIL